MRQRCPTCEDLLPYHREGCTQPICPDCGAPVSFESRHRIVLGVLTEHPLQASRCDSAAARAWQAKKQELASLTREERRRLGVRGFDSESISEGLRNPDLDSLRGDWW